MDVYFFDLLEGEEIHVDHSASEACECLLAVAKQWGPQNESLSAGAATGQYPALFVRLNTPHDDLFYARMICHGLHPCGCERPAGKIGWDRC